MEKTAIIEKKPRRRGVPKELFYEMRHGKPIYYRDYDKVLSGGKLWSRLWRAARFKNGFDNYYLN